MTNTEIREAGWTGLQLRLAVAQSAEINEILAELERREKIGRIEFKSAGATRKRHV